MTGVVKVGLPLLVGLITLVAAHWGGMQVGDALELAAIVAFAVALALFIVDTQARLAAVADRVTGGFAQTGRLAELAATMERSSLGQPLLAEFLRAAGQVDGRTNPLLQRVARREVERLTAFVRQLQAAAEVSYDGEDRDWLLGLTQEAESSIDAISLSTVDAGVLGLDGGLWTSDLGIRYLDEQHEAIARGVRIRRIFVLENEALAHDESFLRVTQMQRNAGVQVRMLDHQLIPDYLQAMIFDFIIFDRVVSYETTPFTAGRPGALQTRLARDPTRVQALTERFGKLWAQADPERQIDE
jgi:hypothetical protein